MVPPDRPHPGVSEIRGIPSYAVSLYRVVALARPAQSIYRTVAEGYEKTHEIIDIAERNLDAEAAAHQLKRQQRII